MKLIYISHKEIWRDLASPSGYATIGGFPFHVSAISDLFEQTDLLVTLRAGEKPLGTSPILGRNLTINPLPEPKGKNCHRKLSILFWLPKHSLTIWRRVSSAEAVHAAVPGDVGLIGALVALLQKKPLFVRHCGTWGEPQSLSDRFLFWLLERIAGGCNVVLATGGGLESPSQRTKNIHWIFSTSITKDEYNALKQANPWKRGEILELVVVARLSAQKNVMAIVCALPAIVRHGIDVKLSIVGDGEEWTRLTNRVAELDLTDRVIFHGNVNHPRVLEILSKSHLFVFPTLVKEGFPKAVLEAMACGLPIIASPVSVLPYLIKNGQCGLLLDGTEAESVADAVLKMIADPQAMQSMGGNAREVAEGFTLEKWRDQIKEEIDSAWGDKT